MKQNESRQERKKKNNKEVLAGKDTTGTSKIYYWLIGVLFVVLLLLVVFIFSRSGKNINLEDTGNQTETSQQEEAALNDSSGEESVEETKTPTNSEGFDTDNSDEQNELEETEEIDAGESVVVADDLPYDTSYATDYSNGSSDRVEIKEQVMEVTGLGSDLIENWVGNDGPGRVVATVSSADQTEHYEVFLQYGDGSWSVEKYQRLSEIPSE